MKFQKLSIEDRVSLDRDDNSEFVAIEGAVRQIQVKLIGKSDANPSAGLNLASQKDTDYWHHSCPGTAALSAQVGFYERNLNKEATNVKWND